MIPIYHFSHPVEKNVPKVKQEKIVSLEPYDPEKTMIRKDQREAITASLKGKVKTVVLETPDLIDFNLDTTLISEKSTLKNEKAVIEEYALSKNEEGEPVLGQLMEQANFLAAKRVYGIALHILVTIGAVKVNLKKSS